MTVGESEQDQISNSVSRNTSGAALNSRPTPSGRGIECSSTKSKLNKGTIKRSLQSAHLEELNIYQYTNYREFLNDFYLSKKKFNTSYSMSSFVRKAGLGKNSRGYLKMIIDGKRNLTPHTMRRFSEAMSLKAQEAMYFENLVYFNQSKSMKDQNYYLERLLVSARRNETWQLEVLASQFNYYSNWYYVAIRELVALKDFQEDEVWIVKKLRGKISKKQARDALDELMKLDFIKRNKSGKLVQSISVVKWNGGVFNDVVEKFHVEMMDRAREAIAEDPYEERHNSGVTLSCDRNQLPKIIKKIGEFRDDLTEEFAMDRNPDSVIQINFQAFLLSEFKKKTSIKEKSL